MQLTDVERHDYEVKIAAILQVLADDGEEARTLFPSADILAREMLPDEPANLKVLNALKGLHLAFTVAELKAALKRHAKTLATAAARADALKRHGLGEIDPMTERAFVAAFMAARGYDMNYHRQFFSGADHTALKLEDISNDLRLTAGDLGLTRPRGDLLSVTELGVALAEWANQRRAERKQIAQDRVMTLTPDRNKVLIDAAFGDVSGWYFTEPPFDEAATRKIIWACKRKLLGLPVPQAHMLVAVGAQNTGKTEFMRLLYAPLAELASEVSLQDMLDTRQMDMPEYYILFTDEMAFVERTEPAALKTFLTGKSPSRRPMRTNISEHIAINATVIATANHTIDRLIFDSSGMRRFIEVKPRSRKEIEPHWHEIVAFDWLGLWQSIDPYAPDPLISQFEAELMVKQEQIRNLDNTEMWLRSFEPEQHRDYSRRETSSKEHIEYFAQELYGLFRNWERDYDPGFRGTSLQRWGREMRSLIESGRADWNVRVAANRTVYMRDLPEKSNAVVVPMHRGF